MLGHNWPNSANKPVHLQNTGSVRVNPGHGSLASQVGSGQVGSVSLTRFHLCRASLSPAHKGGQAIAITGCPGFFIGAEQHRRAEVRQPGWGSWI